MARQPTVKPREPGHASGADPHLRQRHQARGPAPGRRGDLRLPRRRLPRLPRRQAPACAPSSSTTPASASTRPGSARSPTPRRSAWPPPPAAHDSARIGDAADSQRRGRISHANPIARSLGVEPGEPVATAATKLATAPPWHGTPPPYQEARTVLDDRSPRVILHRLGLPDPPRGRRPDRRHRLPRRPHRRPPRAGPPGRRPGRPVQRRRHRHRRRRHQPPASPRPPRHRRRHRRRR